MCGLERFVRRLRSVAVADHFRRTRKHRGVLHRVQFQRHYWQRAGGLCLVNPASGTGPQLVETSVSTEPYSCPPSTIQRRGPTPYGMLGPQLRHRHARYRLSTPAASNHIARPAVWTPASWPATASGPVWLGSCWTRHQVRTLCRPDS